MLTNLDEINSAKFYLERAVMLFQQLGDVSGQMAVKDSITEMVRARERTEGNKVCLSLSVSLSVCPQLFALN